MSSNTINPKPCNYGCNTRIYWNTSENAYFEVFAKKKHICPNRTNGKSNNITQATTTPAPKLTITITNLQNNQNQKCLIPSSYCKVQ